MNATGVNAPTHPVQPEEIMALLDGEIGSERARSISAHVAECAGCQEVSRALETTSVTLSGWAVSPIPDWRKTESHLGKVAGKSVETPRSNGLHFMLSRPSKSLAKAGCLVFATVFLFYAMRLATSTPSYRPMKAVHAVDLARTNSEATPGNAFTTKLPSGGPVTDERSRVTTLSGPGVAADSNGLMHGLGDHAGNSVTVDGWPPKLPSAAPMIARTVSLSIVAKDFGSSRAALDAIVARHHGYAANLTANTEQSSGRWVQVSLRIPAAELNSAVADLKLLGTVKDETQSGEEVTQQHADLIARLKNARETETRLQDILRNHTGKISDVLSVEQEIARVRGEVEQMEAEQKGLEHRLEFATVDLRLAEEYKAELGSPSPSIATRFHNAAVSGFRDDMETVVSILLFFVEYGPTLCIWLLLLAPVGWFGWRRWRQSLATASAGV